MYSTAPRLSPQGLHIRYHEILFSPMYTLKHSFITIKPGIKDRPRTPRHTRLPRVQKFSPMIAKKFIFARYDPHIPWSPIFQMKSPLKPSNINASHCYSPTETLCNSQASNEKALRTPVIPRGARLCTKAKQYFYGTKVSFLKI